MAPSTRLIGPRGSGFHSFPISDYSVGSSISVSNIQKSYCTFRIYCHES